MEIVRKELKSLVPINIRYNGATDTFEILNPATGDWEDSPESDPRNINLYPAPGSTERCNSAARMSALLQEITTTAINAVQSGLSPYLIGTLILLGIATGGGFWLALLALFVAFGGIVTTIGYAALYGAFSTFDWQDLTCKIFCATGSTGQISASGVADVKALITAEYTSDQASVLNGIIDLLGYGGLNAAGFLRDETGDCDECAECGWCYVFSDALGNFTTDWIPQVYNSFTRGTYNGGWRGTAYHDVPGNWAIGLDIRHELAQSIVVKRIEVDFDLQNGSAPNQPGLQFRLYDASGNYKDVTAIANGNDQQVVWTGSRNLTSIRLYMQTKYGSQAQATGSIWVKAIRLFGDAEPSPGESNCE